uniref:ATP synthase subunit a n=1 Tax=Macrocheles muscaedomesticae TaxID=406086 RepID=A0A6B9WG67_9ACAR|nr:ATP synthase F0 subunit 6 [Macrocheles muscaedomesticae]QHQ98526.1 ATP synthase subunit 6 [Macrocheles muscaedomesticae]
MLMNLFSIFDPSTSPYFSMNWMILFIIFLLLPNMFWKCPSRVTFIFKNITLLVLKEININIKNHNMKSAIIFICLFYFILFNNIMGLYPYVFTATSHLSVSLMLAFPAWLTMMLWGWIINMNHMFTHLVPMGTPMMLTSFMVIIESISLIIRPITLSVRLTANMIAGHLLLSLLSNISEKMPTMYLPTFLIINTLLCLEYAVAIIQSYVFITLVSLYLSEIN